MQATKIINLTPHTVNFTNGKRIPSSGTARVAQKISDTGKTLNGIPLTRSSYGAVKANLEDKK